MQQVCNKRGIDVVVSHGWWERYCSQDPNISLQSAAMLSQARVMGVNDEANDEYFDHLERILTEYNLLDNQVATSTWMKVEWKLIDPKSLKVVASKVRRMQQVM